ncbi:MAG: hypothetical protein JEY79_09765 [Pseudodesulfovibrio sp.]|nr:hypothetical protein [Pseudodesulfovibrio sp.]
MRYRVSPAILADALKQDVDIEELGRLFALGTSSLKIGKIFKTTGLERTNMADDLLLKIAQEKSKPSLMEIGVSDGSSALGLLIRSDVFGRVVLTDRFSRFYVRKIPFGKVFLDAEERLYGVKLLCFFVFLSPRTVSNVSEYVVIEVVNPILREKYGIKAITRFNMFEDVLDEPVDIIKCANILNKAYFSDEEIHAAVKNICRSLNDGGSIVVTQNNEQYVDGEAGFILRKEGDGVILKEAFNEHYLVNLFSKCDG